MVKRVLTTKEVLTRNVAEILPDKKGLALLMKKRKIRLYFGVDPTGVQLHLGHAVLLRKLREFQDLGHEVILVFGTFTAQIGDPSGKDTQREPLSLQAIRKNMATYKKQAAKVLDLKKTKIKMNGDWLGKLTFGDLVKLSSQFTVAQLMERDMFQKRVEKGNEVWVSELLYPLMQGYDSVAMDVDLEIGGTDQTFNMLAGRKLQKVYNKKEKYMLAVPLLIGLDGRKMSKSYGNTIDLMDDPKDMYGKLMSLKDEYIIDYFTMCTEALSESVDELKRRIEKGEVSPRDAKAQLAREVVTLYHGKGIAEKVEKEFQRVFQERKEPSDIPEVSIAEKRLPLIDLLVKVNFASSKSEARRLIQQKGVRVANVVIEEEKEIEIKKGTIIQVGKRKFIKLV